VDLVVQLYIPSWLCDQLATVYAVQAAIWLVITCVVQVCVMDSRAYASLTPGMETAEELDACTLLVNSQVCAHNALILCIHYTCDILSCACHVLQSILCTPYCSTVPVCAPSSSVTSSQTCTAVGNQMCSRPQLV
jgi:hypothetical protein